MWLPGENSRELLDVIFAIIVTKAIKGEGDSVKDNADLYNVKYIIIVIFLKHYRQANMQMVKYPTQLKETKSSCNPRKIIIVSIQLPSTVSSIFVVHKR